MELLNSFWQVIPQDWLTIALLILMFIGFIRETYPAEVIALFGAVAMLTFGIVSLEDFQLALSNSAPWTIAALLVLSGTLTRTGVVALFSTLTQRMAQQYPRSTLVFGSMAIVIISAFMNNTPLVVIMLPLVLQVGKTLGLGASKVLIPLSYFAILGGMLTLLGTSTNLLVAGIAKDSGLEPFSIFEVTPLSVFVVGVGFLYVMLLAPRLLPERVSMAEMLVDRKKMSFFTEVAVPENSPVIGRKVMEVELFKREGMRVIDVLRGDESLRRLFPDVALQPGDRVVLKTGVNELLSLKQSRALAMVDKLSSRKTVTVEALITPSCGLVGKRLGDLRLRRHYGVYTLAVHRRSQNLGRQLDDIVVRVGDTILLEGTPEDIQRVSQELQLLDLSETSARAYRREKAPMVLLIWVGMLLLSSFNILPIFFAALIALSLVLLLGAIDVDEAIDAVEGRILLLIFSMIVVAQGLEDSGAIQKLVNLLGPALGGLPPFFMIWAVYLTTSIMTEFLSNNAVAVIMTPVAIALAASIGVEPRAFVVAVMLAASCAFSTPIGYQTNMMVYGPGGYKFMDFVKMGAPLNLLLGIVGSALIPIFFPL